MDSYMTHREDLDLEFFQECDNDDLDILVQILTTGKDGEDRVAQQLKDTKRYKEHYPDHVQYWDLIAAELQTYGANTFGTLFRGGKGVLYREVLTDVCDKLKVNYNKASAVVVIEMNLLMKVLVDSLDKMDPGQIKKLVGTMDLKTTSFTKQGVVAALQGAIRLGGFRSYQTAVIVANAVAKAVIGRGLSLGANATLVKAVSVFAGPIGLALTAIWTLIDVGGPAYRVTIPAVVHVAYMRAKAQYSRASDTEIE